MRVPEHLPREFTMLLEDVSRLDAASLREAVARHAADIRNATLRFPGAERLKRRAAALERAALALLDLLPRLEPGDRDLALAAVAYFVDDEDDHPDTESALGLGDDVDVMNWVLRRLGRPELQGLEVD